MKIWLVTVGEPLQSDAGSPRLLRTGILSSWLAKMDHEVTWWTSTFDHTAKRQRFGSDKTLFGEDGQTVKLVYGPSYLRNVSFRRILNHGIVAKRWADSARVEPRPDLIVSSMPTVELAFTTTAFAVEVGVPVVVDIRDKWPDAILELVPNSARPFVKLGLEPWYRALGAALRRSTAITAVSSDYLDWALDFAGFSKRASDRIFPLGYRETSIDAHSSKMAGERLRRLGVDGSKTIILYSGAFGSTCDLNCAIAAARILEQQGKVDVQFVFCGAGDKEREFQRNALGARNVVFTGWLDTDGLAYVRSVADIGLAAYSKRATQSLPNKLFDYMSAGIPLLSSLEGEAASILLENEIGLNYRPEDAADLVGKILRLVDDDQLRRTMGTRARRCFESQFSAEVVYAELAEFLVEMAVR